MESHLCDELIQEILRRLPPSASPSVCLVSRRWLAACRAATSAISLRIPNISSEALPAQFSNILSKYHFLTDLTVVSAGDNDETSADVIFSILARSECAGRLYHLRFLPNSPVSSSALLSSAYGFRRLTSLQITSFLPISFRWLPFLPCLKSFSLIRSRPKYASGENRPGELYEMVDGEESYFQLPIENLSLSGIRAGDVGLSWLWRRCGNLRRLQLRACEGTGDGQLSSSSASAQPSFLSCLHGLYSLELRTCRTIADRVLLLAAEHSQSLTSLLLYDGGSRDALHHFIHQRGAALRTLDLRLPLDLHNDHLLAIAADRDHRRASSRNGQLAALRLQSCCLVTGDGLRSLAQAPVGAAIEELALVSCDVVEREPGLLTFLVQNMLQLRRLDLSHNEALTDKEVGSMLASCSNLVEIRLRGCGALTGATLTSLLKYCSRRLDLVDITRCPGISTDAVEILALNAINLTQMIVEECKVSELAKGWMGRKASNSV